MTHTHAIVWHYMRGTNSSDPSSVQRIRLLYPSTNPKQPLPLGVLMPTSAEPAILVVNPTSGKITFWESLNAAVSADANRQKQQCVQGNVSGLMSGETITNITEAEPRGFVLTLSTGRLAHLTISDVMGKPIIQVHYLRNTAAQGAGVLGSLRSVFSISAWKRDVAAVRAGRSIQRGQKYMVVATTTGAFQTWDLSWNGTQTLVGDLDARNDILKALSEGAEVFHDGDDHLFELLDFTIIPSGLTGKEVVKAQSSASTKLMALTVLKGRDVAKYALVGMTLLSDTVVIDVVHPIKCYRTPLSSDSPFRPQLLIPEPSQTAFVVLEKSVVLISLVEVEESPETQLQLEAHNLPDPFQDVIDLNSRKPYKIVGCASEPSGRNPGRASCIVMVYGFGLVRVEALPMEEGQSVLDRGTVTARTKIEQAVFFGSLRQDLLEFTPRPEMEFLPADVEEAALSVSRSIMDSTSQYLPKSMPSVDQQLQLRATALLNLNKHLRRHHATLSRQCRWCLLWDAEKMASAQELWLCYDSAVQHPKNTTDMRNVFTEMIEAIHPRYKKENRPEYNETDGVRHWFTHDLWRLEAVIPYAEEIVELMFKESIEDQREFDLATKARMVDEATDIQLAVLATAFRFRDFHAVAYGLDEEMSDGLLESGYEGIPPIWTSSATILQKVKMLTDLSREMACLLDIQLEEDVADDEMMDSLLLKLAQDNSRQVDVCCKIYIERSRWMRACEELQTQEAGKALQRSSMALRKELLTKLTEIGQTDAALGIAEKYHDMDALAEVIEEELHHSEQAHEHEASEALRLRIIDNFVKYGTPWANAFFSQHLNGIGAVQILDQNEIFQQHLTKFLRHHASFAKVGWINEVVSEHEYGLASDFLDRAQQQSTTLWAQKIALSMRKLTLQAAQTANNSPQSKTTPLCNDIDRSLACVKIQERLFAYLKPRVADALDAEAETELALQRHGSIPLQAKPSLRSLLRHNFESLLSTAILTPDELIDTLTLITPEVLSSEPASFTNVRFYEALRILKLLFTADPARRLLHEQLIWRRCILADDWPALNRTETKPSNTVTEETSRTALFQTLYHGFLDNFWNVSLQPPTSLDDDQRQLASLLEAGTTIASLRTSSQYDQLPEARLSDFAADLARESADLAACVEKGRLAAHWPGIVEEARLAARREADRQGEAEAHKREVCLTMDGKANGGPSGGIPTSSSFHAGMMTTTTTQGGGAIGKKTRRDSQGASGSFMGKSQGSGKAFWGF